MIREYLFITNNKLGVQMCQQVMWQQEVEQQEQEVAC